MKLLKLGTMIFDPSDQYNIYFQNGSQSLYNSRFGKTHTIEAENFLLKKCFNQLISHQALNSCNQVVKILDFGCGNGRLFELLTNYCKLYPTINFEIISYDISRVGLEEYRKKILQTQGFVEIKHLNSNFFISKFKHDNITISLVLEEANSCRYLNTLKHNISIIICFFGVLSHIRFRSSRIKLLKKLRQSLVTSGVFIPTVAAYKTLPQEYNFFYQLKEFHRESQDCNTMILNKKFAKLINEEGDVCYVRRNNNKLLINYCHIFTAEELAEDLREAGFTFDRIKVFSLLYLPVLSRMPKIIRVLDCILSRLFSCRIFPYSLINKISDQMYAIAYPTKNSSKELKDKKVSTQKITSQK